MSDTDTYTIQRIDKAHGLAVWSFIGIVVPLIGLILAYYAQSILKSLDKEHASEHELGRIKSINSISSVGFLLSLICSIIWVIKLA